MRTMTHLESLLTRSFARWGIVCLVACLLTGCSEKPTAPPAETKTAEKEQGPPPPGQTEPDVEYDSIELPNPAPGDKSIRNMGTKTLEETVEYYLGGPQQGSPPDGQLEAGTEVRILEQAGSYTLIETEDGIRAYVSSSAVGVLE